MGRDESKIPKKVSFVEEIVSFKRWKSYSSEEYSIQFVELLNVSLVNWTIVCSEKQKGGLGIRNLSL